MEQPPKAFSMDPNHLRRKASHKQGLYHDKLNLSGEKDRGNIPECTNAQKTPKISRQARREPKKQVSTKR